MEVIVHQKPVVDFDDKVAQVTVAASAVDTEILTFRTRTGRRARLVGFAFARDSGGEAYVTVRLLSNGAEVYSYGSSVNQWSDPANINRLPVPVDLPQNAYIQVVASNSNTTDGYATTARVQVEYEDF